MNTASLLFIYTFLICILPNGIGFHFVIDIRIWMILAVILIFPSFVVQIAKKTKLDRLDSFMLVYILLLSFSIFFVFGLKSGFGSIEKNFLYIFLPYFAGRYFIRNEKDLLKFFYVLSFTSVVVCFIALLEYNSGKALFDFSRLMINPNEGWISSNMAFERHELYRGAATFVHPIWFGIFLLLVVLINLLILIHKKIIRNIFIKIGLIVQIILAIIITMISQSRTAIVSFILVFILVLATSLKKRQIVHALIFFLLVSLTIIPIIYFFFQDYLHDFVTLNLTSKGYAQGNIIARIKIIVGSLEYMFKYFNLFGEARVKYLDLKQFIATYDLTNGFLRVFLLNGMFCALLYLYFWLKGLKESYKISKYNVYGSILIFVMIYLFIADNATVLRFQVQIIFFIILGITFNPFLKKLRVSIDNDSKVLIGKRN